MSKSLGAMTKLQRNGGCSRGLEAINGFITQASDFLQFYAITG
jgi:hypothetical protein